MQASTALARRNHQVQARMRARDRASSVHNIARVEALKGSGVRKRKSSRCATRPYFPAEIVAVALSGAPDSDELSLRCRFQDAKVRCRTVTLDDSGLQHGLKFGDCFLQAMRPLGDVLGDHRVLDVRAINDPGAPLFGGDALDESRRGPLHTFNCNLKINHVSRLRGSSEARATNALVHVHWEMSPAPS